MTLVSIALAAAVIGARAGAADACTCPDENVNGRVVPGNGSTNVPVNTNVLVVAPFSEAVTLRRAGVTLAVTGRQWERVAGNDETWHLLEPSSLLANTVYEVVVGQSAISRFTTGSSVDVVPPDFDGIAAASGFVFPDSAHDTCRSTDPLQRIEVDYDASDPDIVLTLLRVRRPDDGVRFFEAPIIVRPGESSYATGRILENTYCSPRAPMLAAGETYCASVVAYDAAGNVAGETVERCFDTTTCLPDETDSFNPPCETVTPSGGGGCDAGGGRAAGLLALLGVAFVARRRRA